MTLSSCRIKKSMRSLCSDRLTVDTQASTMHATKQTFNRMTTISHVLEYQVRLSLCVLASVKAVGVYPEALSRKYTTAWSIRNKAFLSPLPSSLSSFCFLRLLLLFFLPFLLFLLILTDNNTQQHRQDKTLTEGIHL